MLLYIYKIIALLNYEINVFPFLSRNLFSFLEVLVLFDYDGQAEDELTIRKGDVIVDVKKLDGGWWHGKLKTLKGSIQGLFPDNFVMVLLISIFLLE
jgi:hypothetical protein